MLSACRKVYQLPYRVFDMRVASVLKFTILLFCLSFVVFKSKECLVKFFERPQGVELKVSSGIGHPLPHFTFCAEERYNSTVFENCGLHYRNMTYGATWVGDGPEYCKSPKLIMDKARINATELLKEVRVVFENGTSITKNATDECCWKFSEDRYFGSCHTFFMPEHLRPKPVSKLRFYMIENVNWMVHSQGAFVSLKKKDVILYNISDLSHQVYDIDYEVYHMLDVRDEACEKDELYQRDDCYDNAAFQESMETLNCTWPLLRNKDHICTDEVRVKVAKEIGTDYFKRRKGSSCRSSCSYVKVWYYLRKQSKTGSKDITFMFPESIRVNKAFWVYKGLSLIAEIGGYVGLFLGWSVYQITDLFELFFENMKRK